jgi:FkbM family methyltransferase
LALKSTLRGLLPAFAYQGLVRSYVIAGAVRQGFAVKWRGDKIDVRDGNRVVRIGAQHLLYAIDVVKSFDFYFSAVTPYLSNGRQIVDYSFPRFHQCIGYDAHPVMFSSFAEPLVTVEEYLALAGLRDGMTVIDLGAYSGLSSILFKREVGSSGRVVAVEADAQNAVCVAENLKLHAKTGGHEIEFRFGAIWSDNHGLEFSSEGNMGASAVSLVGAGRGEARAVPSFTLSRLAELHRLDTVDFVKCDIEGAEKVIFDDADFFARHRPRIVVEVHNVGGTSTAPDCLRALSKFGYGCREVTQPGVDLALLDCVPGI